MSNKISDYALIGDCHSAALVGRDGSIDWACFPRFDSRSVFCAILDPLRGGSFTCTPERVRSVRRNYLTDTNVLVNTFECEGGVLELVDCMPVEYVSAEPGTRVVGHGAILRRIRCIEGDVNVSIAMTPRFEYGAFIPRFLLLSPTTGEMVGGADALYLTATSPLQSSEDHIEAHWHLQSGEVQWIEATWRSSHDWFTPQADPRLFAVEASRRLEATIAFWRAWMGGCNYGGLHEPAVRRSALVLKALTYAPSGAVLAATTTSLPESIGGARNWDYRYTWIRDSMLTLISLFLLGFQDEAHAFKRWLERTGAGRPSDLQIMYGIGGERSLPELELAHLEGFQNSPPVRVGNGAVKQLQLDAYGQLVEAGYLYLKAGGAITSTNWRFLAGLVDIVCDCWERPDQGIWEIRDTPRQFVHSKLNCWVALDRAVKIARARGWPGAVNRWDHERHRVHRYLQELAAPDGWFQQAVGHPVPDAATLLAPALGFVATTDPVTQRTIEVVKRTLEHGGLVYRYLSADGLEGNEGAFLLCSFWLLDCLIHSGKLDEAQVLLDRLIGCANDVGLFAEEVDVETGELLGNFPQAFPHMALVLSCAHLTAARRHGIAQGVFDYAELALDRLLAAAAARSPAI